MVRSIFFSAGKKKVKRGLHCIAKGAGQKKRDGQLEKNKNDVPKKTNKLHEYFITFCFFFFFAVFFLLLIFF